MKTLMLMRHAKSSWAEPGIDDFDRELNARGRKTAPIIGAWLVEHKLVPDTVLSSTAKRAKETTQLVVESADFQGEVVWEPQLYLAPPEILLEMAAKTEDRYDRLLLVAHNPGLEHLVATLRSQFTAFPTAALACFESTVESWAGVADLSQWKLTELVIPKEL